MPKRTTKKKNRRGGNIKKWIKNAHSQIRKSKGYSRGLTHGYNTYAKDKIEAKFGKHYGSIINSGVNHGLEKLSQAGYGHCGKGKKITKLSGTDILRLYAQYRDMTGKGMRVKGSGTRLAGNGKRLAGNGTRLSGNGTTMRR